MPKRQQSLPRQQDFPRRNPRLPGNPQIRPPGLQNPPSTVPTGFLLAIPERNTTRLPRKRGYPQTRGGLSLLPRIFRRHQHLPLGCQPRSPECSTRFSQSLYDLAGLFRTLQASLSDSPPLQWILSLKTHSSLGKTSLRRSCAPSDYISLRQLCTQLRTHAQLHDSSRHHRRPPLVKAAITHDDSRGS